MIVDDGSDAIIDLVPADERIRYIRLREKTTVGAKRNLACEQARGTIIAHWDDDDWHAPHRLRYQVEILLREGADLCGINTLLFYDIENGRAWQFVYPSEKKVWLSGNTLCYKRTFWISNRFANINVGEDARFVWGSRRERIAILPDATFHVGMIHRQNVSPKKTNGMYWKPYSLEEVRRLLGDDWTFYQPHPAETIADPQPATIALSTHERPISMITVAKEADLALPEFAAFNAGQSLPRMRRWELPFALFQARLSNTMSVLDCTINPVNFQERLTRLYPHTLYRHWNPIQKGQFALPFGVPDESFDRVICVNTLEHLLKPQRENLIAAMARKLKPGGLLIFTSDYYFDSSWEQPAFLQAGVMRADRQEIFNGWNKVTPLEWFELCGRYNLHPLADSVEEPREGDSTLYCNPSPYVHACIAGVFAKSGQENHTSIPPGKKVVLALLTWNTCKISIESIHAYVREAHMLQRLGHQLYLCVCDNGSTDGTADALRALEEEMDIPHKFIFNAENLGNSIARNQIIDYMLECEGDYLLFMDGDIEIVPFSSFAMLRYMENNGFRLGCIGADSGWQTADRGRATPCFYTIDGCKVETTNHVAWTQYGMFRRAIFEDGCRFEQNAPFDRAGWGFEDNDIAFQMEMKGYLNHRFFGMTYLHRAARSSIRIMREQGIDASSLYTRRRQYVIDKWASVPGINNGPLTYLQRISTRL